MLLLFFIGAVIGGAIAGLPFGADGITTANVVLCMLAKLLLVPVFAGIYVMTSVITKQRTWLSMCLSLGVGMLLFMMIPALTPLNATAMNVILCLCGGLVYAIGLFDMENTTKSKVDKYGFGKLDTWFIDKYLKHDNETLDEAKARIAAENEKKVQIFLKKLLGKPKRKQNFNI